LRMIMTAGRIETYTHSDKSTANKGVAVVGVYCQTDFAAKTPEFIAFCKELAKFAYASEEYPSWYEICDTFPSILRQHYELEKLLKETVTISDDQIHVVKLS
jgi:translation elongation factor EF-Ts